MSNYTAALSKHVTSLTANTEDVVTITGNVREIEVKNRTKDGEAGAAPIYFKLGNVAITVGADDTYIVEPGEALVVPSQNHPDVVRVISSGTPAYSVTGVK